MSRIMLCCVLLMLVVSVGTSQTVSKLVASGTLLVPPTAGVDLDAGKFVVAGPLKEVDVWYNAVRPGVFEVRPLPHGKSTIVLIGAQSPGLEGCKSASFSEVPITKASLKSGDYFCVRTHQGRIAQVRVEGFSHSAGAPPTYESMAISFMTWEK